MGLNSSEPQGLNSLSPDLAKYNPEGYSRTLRNIAERRLSGKPIAIIASMAEIKLDTETWVCETTGEPSNPVRIGTQPVPDQIYHHVMFEGSPNRPRTYTDMAVYKFTHELVHKYMSFLKETRDERLENLNAIGTAQKEGVAMTRFSSIDNNGNPNAKALEDCTELINMYLWNPDYLKSYLDFLITPQAPSYGLTQLNKETAGLVFEIIQEIAEQ